MEKFLKPHNPSWKDKFVKEAVVINQVLGMNVLAMHHIGSTAIEGILAKPIIDILIEVLSLEIVDQCDGKMRAAGFQVKGAYGIDGRRYFRKTDDTGKRLCHVHVYETGSPHIVRHIAFRDFLLAHPEWAAQYSDLKKSLVSGKVISRQTYQRGKEPFISALEAKSLEWFAGQNPV